MRESSSKVSFKSGAKSANFLQRSCAQENQLIASVVLSLIAFITSIEKITFARVSQVNWIKLIASPFLLLAQIELNIVNTIIHNVPCNAIFFFHILGSSIKSNWSLVILGSPVRQYFPLSRRTKHACDRSMELMEEASTCHEIASGTLGKVPFNLI